MLQPRGWKQQISLADSKTTYQNSSAPPHENLQPCLNILRLATCNLRPAFVGTQSPKLTIVPSIENEGGKKKYTKILQLYLSTIMASISTTTHDVYPHRFSFQKLADPRTAGPFTRMTSLAQTVPTVLNKAQACFNVGVPVLHWDSCESCEWEDLCTKLVMAKTNESIACHQHSQSVHKERQ